MNLPLKIIFDEVEDPGEKSPEILPKFFGSIDSDNASMILMLPMSAPVSELDFLAASKSNLNFLKDSSCFF